MDEKSITFTVSAKDAHIIRSAQRIANTERAPVRTSFAQTVVIACHEYVQRREDK